MAYEVVGAEKENIVGRRSKQGLVCVLRPNRREPRPVTPRSVASFARTCRFNYPEEQIMFEVIMQLPRVRSELCVLAKLAVIIPPLKLAITTAIAILNLARLISGVVPAGWPSISLFSATILSLELLAENLETYLGKSGFISELARTCEVINNGGQE